MILLLLLVVVLLIIIVLAFSQGSSEEKSKSMPGIWYFDHDTHECSSSQVCDSPVCYKNKAECKKNSKKGIMFNGTACVPVLCNTKDEGCYSNAQDCIDKKAPRVRNIINQFM